MIKNLNPPDTSDVSGDCFRSKRSKNKDIVPICHNKQKMLSLFEIYLKI